MCLGCLESEPPPSDSTAGSGTGEKVLWWVYLTMSCSNQRTTFPTHLGKQIIEFSVLLTKKIYPENFKLWLRTLKGSYGSGGIHKTLNEIIYWSLVFSCNKNFLKKKNCIAMLMKTTLLLIPDSKLSGCGSTYFQVLLHFSVHNALWYKMNRIKCEGCDYHPPHNLKGYHPWFIISLCSSWWAVPT